MDEYRCQGVITVFLSIVSVLFLSLICTLAESARVQGARARAAAITDMGVFSVFGEYEREILENYDVLFLDGGYGGEEFLPERTALQMKDYMQYNIKPEEDLNLRGVFDIFPLELSSLTVTNYSLATDENGAAFYQQAVRNLKDNLGTELAAKYLAESKEAKALEEAAADYEANDELAEQEIADMEEQQRQLEVAKENAKQEKEASDDDTEDGDAETEAVEEIPVPVENPLKTLEQIKKQGILGLVVKDPGALSTKEITLSEYPSVRTLQQGTMTVKKAESGILADALFMQYLTEHFQAMPEASGSGALDYQLEYILIGKNSDTENLKGVVNRLLLLREGVNFLYAMNDTEMRTEAEALGLAIATSVGMPMFGGLVGKALLLGWAYGESLLDVRALLAGGKIPLTKSKDTWRLSLANLGRLTEVLAECDEGTGEGQDYEDYLRILLLIGKKDKYPMRALDMIEGSDENYQADRWIVQIQVTAEWNLKPVFLQVPAAFMGTGNSGSGYQVEADFAY